MKLALISSDGKGFQQNLMQDGLHLPNEKICSTLLYMLLANCWNGSPFSHK